MDKAETPAGTGDARDEDAREIEELATMLRRGKAAVFSEHRDKREEREDHGPQVRKALAAARRASRPRRLRFPVMVGTCAAAAVAALVVWLGVLPQNARPPDVTVVSFVTAESDIAPPLMRGGEAESVGDWLRAAREGAAAVRGADQVRVAEPGNHAGPTNEFLRGAKTSFLLTLEEAERNGEKCLAVRLYSVKTEKMLAERLIFPPDEDDVGAAVDAAAKDMLRQAESL